MRMCVLELKQWHTYEWISELTSGNNCIKLMESSSEAGLFHVISGEYQYCCFLNYLLEVG